MDGGAVLVLVEVGLQEVGVLDPLDSISTTSSQILTSIKFLDKNLYMNRIQYIFPYLRVFKIKRLYSPALLDTTFSLLEKGDIYILLSVESLTRLLQLKKI